MLFEDFGVAACLSLAAIGSAYGAGIAAMGAIGAWKRSFAQEKTPPFLTIVFVGFPLSQTIYAFILMGQIASALSADHHYLGLGIFAGLGMGASALMQGKAAASACDSLAETGKGTTNYIIALGIIETVALFVMVFSMLQIKTFAG